MTRCTQMTLLPAKVHQIRIKIRQKDPASLRLKNVARTVVSWYYSRNIAKQLLPLFLSEHEKGRHREANSMSDRENE